MYLIPFVHLKHAPHTPEHHQQKCIACGHRVSRFCAGHFMANLTILPPYTKPPTLHKPSKNPQPTQSTPGIKTTTSPSLSSSALLCSPSRLQLDHFSHFARHPLPFPFPVTSSPHDLITPPATPRYPLLTSPAPLPSHPR